MYYLTSWRYMVFEEHGEMQEDSLAKLLALCLTRLAARSQWVQSIDDLEAFEARMKQLGKPENHPMISKQWSDLATNDAFGVYIVSEGKIIGGLAARRINLGRDSLAKHLTESYSRLYGGGEKSPVHSQGVATVRDIHGTIVYLGELYLSPEWRGAKIDLASILHYVHCLSALKWHPDWIYGFIRQSHVLSGKAAQYGFTRTYPGAQTWRQTVPRRGNEEYLVAITFDELCEAARFFTRNPSLFSPSKHI